MHKWRFIWNIGYNAQFCNTQKNKMLNPFSFRCSNYASATAFSSLLLHNTTSFHLNGPSLTFPFPRRPLNPPELRSVPPVFAVASLPFFDISGGKGYVRVISPQNPFLCFIVSCSYFSHQCGSCWTWIWNWDFFICNWWIVYNFVLPRLLSLDVSIPNQVSLLCFNKWIIIILEFQVLMLLFFNHNLTYG